MLHAACQAKCFQGLANNYPYLQYSNGNVSEVRYDQQRKPDENVRDDAGQTSFTNLHDSVKINRTILVVSTDFLPVSLLTSQSRLLIMK